MKPFAAAARTLCNHGGHISPGNRRIEKDSLTDHEAQLRGESQNAKRNTQNAKRKTQNVKRKTQNAKRKTQNVKRNTQNAKRIPALQVSSFSAIMGMQEQSFLEETIREIRIYIYVYRSYSWPTAYTAPNPTAAVVTL